MRSVQLRSAAWSLRVAFVAPLILLGRDSHARLDAGIERGGRDQRIGIGDGAGRSRNPNAKAVAVRQTFGPAKQHRGAGLVRQSRQ